MNDAGSLEQHAEFDLWFAEQQALEDEARQFDDTADDYSDSAGDSEDDYSDATPEAEEFSQRDSRSDNEEDYGEDHREHGEDDEDSSNAETRDPRLRYHAVDRRASGKPNQPFRGHTWKGALPPALARAVREVVDSDGYARAGRAAEVRKLASKSIRSVIDKGSTYRTVSGQLIHPTKLRDPRSMLSGKRKLRHRELAAAGVVRDKYSVQACHHSEADILKMKAAATSEYRRRPMLMLQAKLPTVIVDPIDYELVEAIVHAGAYSGVDLVDVDDPVELNGLMGSNHTTLQTGSVLNNLHKSQPTPKTYVGASKGPFAFDVLGARLGQQARVDVPSAHGAMSGSAANTLGFTLTSSSPTLFTNATSFWTAMLSVPKDAEQCWTFVYNRPSGTIMCPGYYGFTAGSTSTAFRVVFTFGGIRAWLTAASLEGGGSVLTMKASNSRNQDSVPSGCFPTGSSLTRTAADISTILAGGDSYDLVVCREFIYGYPVAPDESHGDGAFTFTDDYNSAGSTLASVIALQESAGRECIINTTTDTTPMSWVRIRSRPATVESHGARSVLNGNNGEWTNGDDMPRRSRQQRGRRAQVQRSSRRKPRVAGRATRRRRPPRSQVPVLEQSLARMRIAPVVRPRKTARGPARGPKMSKCARDFARAIVDPFHPEATGVCIPSAPARPTQKVRGFLRTTVTIGTNGIGFLMLCPTVANDRACIFATGPTFSGTDLTPVTNVASPALVTGVSNINMTNLPYASASLYNADAGKTAGTNVVVGVCCAWGVRVRNTSPELNLGGTITCYSDPTRQNMYGMTEAGINGFQDSDIEIGIRRECSMSVYSAQPNEYALSISTREAGAANSQIALLYPLSGGELLASNDTGAYCGACPAAIMFRGVPGNTYLVEVVGHNEYYGRPATAVSTPKIADPDGLSMVLSAADRIPQLKLAKHLDTKQAFFEGLQEVAREMAPVAIRAAINAASSFF